jgi:class 3 adenylate cyclase
MPTVAYEGEVEIPAADPRRTLLDLALAAKIPHMYECGGHARCTTCRVRVLDGHDLLSRRTRVEQTIADQRGWDEFTRLACQARPLPEPAAAAPGETVLLRRLIRTPADVHLVWSETIPRAGTERPLAVLFTDVRRFTTFAREHLPYDVVHVLNQYFAFVCEPVVNNNGFIDKYLGDGVLALFGLKHADPRRFCRDAVRAALGVLHAVEQFNKSLDAHFGVRFDTGIGLHFGVAITGEIGHPSRQQFTAIGDTVNAACRVEAQNKGHGPRVLVSDALHRVIADDLVAHEVAVSPEHDPHDGLRMYEVQGFRAPDPILIAQNALSQILAHPEEFAAAFYERLFATAPVTAELFTPDVRAQGRMFTQMLHTVVRALARFEDVVDGLKELGRRHRGYGVAPHHYPVVKEAFLHTLERVLGPDMDDTARAAWSQIYDTLAQTMQHQGPP